MVRIPANPQQMTSGIKGKKIIAYGDALRTSTPTYIFHFFKKVIVLKYHMLNVRIYRL
jgi:hypothetical protein